MNWTVFARPLAELDVDDFFLYLARDCNSPKAANRFLDALARAYTRLCEHPEIGALQNFERQELRDIRMWPVPGFEDRLIYYIIRDDVIDVVRILGGPQDREEILGENN